MEEVTIKLTMEEARLLRTIMANKADVSEKFLSDHSQDESESMAGLVTMARQNINLFDKINAAINASY